MAELRKEEKRREEKEMRNKWGSYGIIVKLHAYSEQEQKLAFNYQTRKVSINEMPVRLQF